MNTHDFSLCKPGDRLWSFHLDSCVVVSISRDSICCESLHPEMERYRLNYYFCGKVYGSMHQTLFFSKPEILIPESKDPLRMECECYMSDRVIDTDTPYIALCDYKNNEKLKQFINKHTKMILEEIV